MNDYPDQQWLDRSNAEPMYHLERQGRTGPGLVPFLGARISIPFKLKNWRDLLHDAAPPRLAQRIEKLLGKNLYEAAAEALLKELEPDGFQNMVVAAAGHSHLESFDFRVGTVSLLPLLATGPVITTNFDRVLERAFEANGAPFESVISGPRPDLIVDALHGNRRVLIKLHGDWQDRVGRTFAKSDYDANYGKAQPERKRELLEGAEGLLFSSRSLLFIGASLGPDRTVTLLQRVHKEYAGIRHFAIMHVPKKQEAFEKERHLSMRSASTLVSCRYTSRACSAGRDAGEKHCGANLGPHYPRTKNSITAEAKGFLKSGGTHQAFFPANVEARRSFRSCCPTHRGWPTHLLPGLRSALPHKTDGTGVL